MSLVAQKRRRFLMCFGPSAHRKVWQLHQPIGGSAEVELLPDARPFNELN
jgi:hypothetical protein